MRLRPLPAGYAAIVAASAIGAWTDGASGQGIPPVTSCGTPYTFAMPHRTVLSGSCAALLPLTPPSAHIRRRLTFSVRIGHEQNGRLDFPIPTPTTGAVKRLRRTGATVTYLAASPGVTLLIAHHTRFCQALDPSIGSCAVLKVIVVRG